MKTSEKIKSKLSNALVDIIIISIIAILLFLCNKYFFNKNSKRGGKGGKGGKGASGKGFSDGVTIINNFELT